MAERPVFFGGAFDPVHHGHLIVARAVAEACGFARVTLVPTGQPPHKPPPAAAAEHRLAMLRLAIEGDGLFDLCDLELARPGPSYTIETVAQLRQQHGRQAELCWLVGADMLEDLPNWRRAEELLETVRVVVASRPPWDRRMAEVFASLEGRLAAEQVRRLSQAVVATPLIDISSAQIRRRVAEGRPTRYLMPDAVCEYVGKYGLYRTVGGR